MAKSKSLKDKGAKPLIGELSIYLKDGSLKRISARIFMHIDGHIYMALGNNKFRLSLPQLINLPFDLASIEGFDHDQYTKTYHSQ